MAKPPRILTIDNDPSILDFYRDLFCSEGYEVVTSRQILGNPGDVERMHPDVIILDWLISTNALGMQAITALANYLPTAKIPIVICTAAGKSLEPVESTLMERGMRVIHKPFSLDDLLSTVEEALTTVLSCKHKAT